MDATLRGARDRLGVQAMQPIDFYQLERTAQERFVGSVNGAGLPAPIVGTTSEPVAPRVWIGASAACFVLLIAVLITGYGNLHSRLAILGPIGLAALVVLASLVTFGLVRAAALSREHRASPFRPGVYVFPVGLIDARKTILHLYPIEDLAGVFGPDARGLTLDFGGRLFSFPVADPARVTLVKEQLAAARTAIGEAGAARESIRPKALAALDPLQGYANPLASSDGMTRPVVPWAGLAWAIAGLSGLVLGGTLWMLRNTKSDDAMFAHAVLADDPDSFRGYLERGRRHTLEVTSVLLPRAELHEVVKAGDTGAIENFLAEHPRGAVAVEAGAALKTALLADSRRRHEDGHSGAYRRALAAQQSPPHRRRDRRRASRRLRGRARSLRRDDRRQGRAVDRARPAARRMVREERTARGDPVPDPEVEDDGPRGPSRGPEPAMEGGRVAPVPLLRRRRREGGPRRAHVGDFPALRPGISCRISGLVVGDPIPDPDAPLPAQIVVPTLFVELGSMWAGSIQASQKPRGVFVGLKLVFDATFRMPDATKPLKVKLDVWRVPELAQAIGADKPEDVVYGLMRSKAFEQFQKKLLGTFFSPQ